MLQQQIGDSTIHRILESERPDFDAAGFFPQITPKQWAPYTGGGSRAGPWTRR
jgi:hypothetical protein